jgi:hypothetical protein
MTPPIIVVGDGGIDLFDDVAAAESSMEAIDVANGEYVAYDSKGMRLALTVSQKKRWIGRIDLVRIEELPNSICETEALLSALREFLLQIGFPQIQCDNVPLSELIQMALRNYERR